MNRRRFLEKALVAGLVLGSGGVRPTVAAASSHFPLLGRRFLVNVLLEGGPDFRHLFPPPFTLSADSYGHRHWMERARSHSTEASVPNLQNRWDKD